MIRTEPRTPLPPMEAGSDELLTVRELGAILKISPATVYRLVDRRQVPFYRLPHKLRFRKRDVEAYLAGTRVDAMVR